MTGLLAIAIAYLLGSIPFGFLLTRWSTGRDVRASGSGNIGATNVMRAAGRGVGLATLVLDMAKGVLAVAVSGWLTGDSAEWQALAALAVCAGHVFPAFLNFKGGKAVATFAGAFGFLMPLPLLATFLVFTIMVGYSGYISAGSVMGAVTFPLGAWLILHPGWIEMLAAIAACALIIYRHQDNIRRIHAGNESVFRWSK